MNRRSITVALLACVGLPLLLIFTPTVAAKCAYPTITLNTPRGERGATVTLKGEFFWLRCNDDVMILPGMTRPPVLEPAAKGIRVLFNQNNRSTLLATVDAGADLRFSVNITVPADAAIGKATFVAEADSYPRYVGTAFGPREMILPVAFEVVQGLQQ